MKRYVAVMDRTTQLDRSFLKEQTFYSIAIKVAVSLFFRVKVDCADKSMLAWNKNETWILTYFHFIVSIQ